MTWYVAVVAIANLALGYALAKMLGASGERVTSSLGGMLDDGDGP
jgi:hypothetical protein